jgi:hypothetical protein
MQTGATSCCSRMPTLRDTNERTRGQDENKDEDDAMDRVIVIETCRVGTTGDGKVHNCPRSVFAEAGLTNKAQRQTSRSSIRITLCDCTGARAQVQAYP